MFGVGISDYGPVVPNFMRTSPDPVLRSLEKKLDLIPQTSTPLVYEHCIEALMDRTHIIIEAYSYVSQTRQKFNITEQTYMLDSLVCDTYT